MGPPALRSRSNLEEVLGRLARLQAVPTATDARAMDSTNLEPVALKRSCAQCGSSYAAECSAAGDISPITRRLALLD